MYVLHALRGMWTRRPVRWAAASLVGAVWWWAVVRLVAQPGQAGPVEGLVAAGGWGLGLIPLHATTRTARSSWLPHASRAARRASVPVPRVPLPKVPRPRRCPRPEQGRIHGQGVGP
jgi:hypothetical protein